MDQTSRKIINFDDFDVWDSKDFWQINHSIEDPVTDHTQDQSRPFCFPLLLTVGPEVDENVEQRISNFAKFSPKTALALTGHVEIPFETVPIRRYMLRHATLLLDIL